jgi:hypothetical protein
MVVVCVVWVCTGDGASCIYVLYWRHQGVGGFEPLLLLAMQQLKLAMAAAAHYTRTHTHHHHDHSDSRSRSTATQPLTLPKQALDTGLMRPEHQDRSTTPTTVVAVVV